MDNGRGLGAFRYHGSAAYDVALPDLHGHIPQFIRVQRVDGDTPGYILAGCFRDRLQRPLNTVKNVIQNTGAQRDGHGIARAVDDLTGLYSAGLLVDLDGGNIICKRNHFADKTFRSDINHLRHLESDGILKVNDRPVDAVNHTCFFCHQSPPPTHT